MYLPTEDLGILQNSLTCICAFQNELEFEREGETRVPLRKTSQRKGENHQQTQPTFGVDPRIQTRATLVGGVCSHRCTSLTPQ